MDTIKYKFSTIESHAHAQCYDIQPQWKLFAVHHLYSCLKILKIYPTCFKISTVGVLHCRCMLNTIKWYLNFNLIDKIVYVFAFIRSLLLRDSYQLPVMWHEYRLLCLSIERIIQQRPFRRFKECWLKILYLYYFAVFIGDGKGEG